MTRIKDKIPLIALTQVPLLALSVVLAYRHRQQEVRRQEYEQRLAAVACDEIYGSRRAAKSFEAFEPVTEPLTPEIQEWAKRHGLEMDG